MGGRALLARNLRRIRLEKGLSQERLAADTGVDRAYVSEIERQQGNATVDLLDRLAAVLGVGIADLFAHERGGNRPPELRRGRRAGGS